MSIGRLRIPAPGEWSESLCWLLQPLSQGRRRQRGLSGSSRKDSILELDVPSCPLGPSQSVDMKLLFESEWSSDNEPFEGMIGTDSVFCDARESFGEGGNCNRYNSRKESVLVNENRLAPPCLPLKLFNKSPPFSKTLELTEWMTSSSYSAQPLSRDFGSSALQAWERSCIWYSNWSDIISASNTLYSVSVWFVPGGMRGKSGSSNMAIVCVYLSWLGDFTKRSSSSLLRCFSSWRDFSSPSRSSSFNNLVRFFSSSNALSYSCFVCCSIDQDRLRSSSRALCSRCFSRSSLLLIFCLSMSTAASSEAWCIPSRTRRWLLSSKSVLARFSFSLRRFSIYKKWRNNVRLEVKKFPPWQKL